MNHSAEDTVLTVTSDELVTISNGFCVILNVTTRGPLHEICAWVQCPGLASHQSMNVWHGREGPSWPWGPGQHLHPWAPPPHIPLPESWLLSPHVEMWWAQLDSADQGTVWIFGLHGNQVDIALSPGWPHRPAPAQTHGELNQLLWSQWLQSGPFGRHRAGAGQAPCKCPAPECRRLPWHMSPGVLSGEARGMRTSLTDTLHSHTTSIPISSASR